MTTKQANPKSRDEQYTRAVEIARKDGLVVKAIAVAGERMYIVVRPKTLSTHVVRRESAGLVCDSTCASTRFGNYCAHRGAVRSFLIAERKAEQTPVSTPAPVAAQVRHADRETAMLASRADNRGFSIWASEPAQPRVREAW